MHDSFIFHELGEERNDYFNAIAPPIIQTSNFAFNNFDDFQKAFHDPYNNLFYSRGNNPTLAILRKKLAALDGAEDCLLFGSGIAAISTPILALLKSGDHIVSVARPYGWVQRLFDVMLPRFGITTTYIDGTDVDHYRAALQPNTRLLYMESPNTFSFELQDIQAVARLAREHGAYSMIDNSYCTPLLQKPIALGVDLSAQSATKYISGHGDVLAGVVSGRKELIQRIYLSEHLIIGAGISPFSAWLLLRGLRTLPLRLKQVCETTKTIVEYLHGHSAVDRVLFPWGIQFTQQPLAELQMKDAGGLLSFTLLDNSLDKIKIFANALKRFKLSFSWGGYESLAIPYSISLKEEFNPANKHHGLIRLYVGLEDSKYLQEDLEQALAAVQKA